MRWGGWAFWLATTSVVPCAAQGDVRELAERVQRVWSGPGTTVVRLPARFVFEDESVVLPMPQLVPGRCTAIAVVGPRGMSFHVRAGGGSQDDPLDLRIERASSVAGVAQLVRCAAGGDFSRLRITSDAGRGALEIVVARAPELVHDLTLALLERSGPVGPSPAEPGGPAPVLPPARRADDAEARAHAEHAQIVERTIGQAGDDGTDAWPVVLTTGCHRFEMFGAEHAGQRRGRFDLDAELREDESEDALAKDRSEAADVHLESCVGEPTAAHLIIAGAGQGGSVSVVHAVWPLPASLPSTWGPVARARMAHALTARHALAPPEPAVEVAQGVAGNTPIPLSLLPGSCYVAIVVMARGVSRGIGLRAVLGGREIADDRGPTDVAGLVTFCANEHAKARVDVEARGTGVAWGLAVFRTHAGVWP